MFLLFTSHFRMVGEVFSASLENWWQKTLNRLKYTVFDSSYCFTRPEPISYSWPPSEHALYFWSHFHSVLLSFNISFCICWLSKAISMSDINNELLICTSDVVETTLKIMYQNSRVLFCHCTWFVQKVSVLNFYLNVYWTHLKLQVISFKVWPLGSYTVVPKFSPLIIAVLEVIFRKCV